MKGSEYVFDVAPSKMDNHADTHVFGRKFRVYLTASKRCPVSPLLPKYSKQLKVTIVTGVTEVDLENVSTMVLIFGNSLWFGDIVEKSLINPKQCRNYDFLVCNVPTDKYSEIGLAIYDNIFIPTNMYGTTCGFDSRCPTMEEMESCKWITVSHETDWDPSMVH